MVNKFVKDADSAHDEILNPSQKNHFLVTLKYADQLLSEIEQILNPGASQPLFPRFIHDVTPEDVQQIRAGITEFRNEMTSALQRLGISPSSAQISALHATTTNLDYVDMELEDLGPRAMRAYGEVTPLSADQIKEVRAKLQIVLRRLMEYVRQSSGAK